MHVDPELGFTALRRLTSFKPGATMLPDNPVLNHVAEQRSWTISIAGIAIGREAVP